jgi:hypothetical protein
VLHIMKIDAIIGERTNAEIERAINKAQLVTDKLWHGDLSKEDLLSYYVAQTIEKHLVADIEERIKELEGAENVHKE